MNLRDKSVFSGKTLEYFIQLTESMNYTQAAEKLGISQPALTQRIKRFEKAIGTPLFYFKGKEMHLTETGQSMLRASKAVYTIFRSVAEEIEESNIEIEDYIRIGMLMSIEEQQFIDFLAAYYEENEKGKVSLYSMSREELWNQLEQDQLDIALLYLPDETIKDWNAYEHRAFLSEELYFYHPGKTFTEKERISLKETTRNQWTTYLPTLYINDLLRSAFRKENLNLPTVSGYFTTPNQVLRFSEQTGHCTALPRTFFEAKWGEEKQNILPFEPPIQYSLSFVYRKEKEMVPRIARFFQYFENYFNETNTNSRLKG